MREVEPNTGLLRNPITWGIFLTFLLGCLVFYLGLKLGTDGKPRYVEFLEGQPNTIGDTLAGIFAPLAFIWIVVTVFLQSHELREQRRELSFSRDELKLAREAQEAQLRVMQKQADIFEHEQLQRMQGEAQLEASELLRDLVFQATFESRIAGAEWVIERQDGRGFYQERLFLKSDQSDYGEMSEDTVIRNISLRCYSLVKRLRLAEEAGELFERNAAKGFYFDVLKVVSRIVSMNGRLSQHQQIRLQSLGIASIENSLREALSLNLWREEHQ